MHFSSVSRKQGYFSWSHQNPAVSWTLCVSLSILNLGLLSKTSWTSKSVHCNVERWASFKQTIGRNLDVFPFLSLTHTCTAPVCGLVSLKTEWLFMLRGCLRGCHGDTLLVSSEHALKREEDLAEAWQAARGGLPDAFKWAVSFFFLSCNVWFFF